MAILIKFLRAKTLDDLEYQINEFFVTEGKDVRTEIDLAGGISFANGEYVAPLRLSAPHKRQFQTVAEEEATHKAAAAAEAEAQEQASVDQAEGASASE